MFRYIVLVVAVGTACAAPASPSTSTLESTGELILPNNLTPESSPPSAPASTLALALALAPAPAAAAPAAAVAAPAAPVAVPAAPAVPAPAPALDPAPAPAPDQAPAPAPIATLPPGLQDLPLWESTAKLSAGRSSASSAKALSLLFPVRTPASTTKLSHMIHATPLLQIPQYAYALPAVAPLELAAAPSSYSIEQHGYSITY